MKNQAQKSPALAKFEKAFHQLLEVRLQNESTVLMLEESISKQDILRLSRQFDELWKALSESEKAGRSQDFNLGFSILTRALEGRFKITPRLMGWVDQALNA